MRRPSLSLRTATALVALTALTACSSGQDPGLTPSTQDGPTTTSHPLTTCPPGGPDATTPPAGCIDDGVVVRP